jgi:D-alanyl-D-alanine carboxypeptidase
MFPKIGSTLSAERCAVGLALVFAVGAVSVPSIASGSEKQSAMAEAEAALVASLDDVAKAGDVPGIVLSINIPQANLSINRATGNLARRDLGTPPSDTLKATDEFRIASVTKTYTAAAILRLVEMRKVKLDIGISRYISPESAALLRADGYDPNEITVRQLLSHSSGLYDYATDVRYLAAIGENPGRLWTLREQVAHAMIHGSPIAKPGLVYSYSDTGYALLAEILTRSTGMSFGPALSKLIGFEKLALKRTYLETVSEGPVMVLPPRRIHQYQDGIDTSQLNPSFDIHGGGGLVSTAPDVARFFQALFEGRVFARPKTLEMMLTIKPGIAADRGTEPYALGIKPMRYGKADCWGHVGHWGIVAGVCPSLNMSFAYAGNAAGEKGYAALDRVTDAVSKFAQKVAPIRSR